MPESFDLETLVRAARPEPRPQWAGRMDRSVAERFPRPPRWWRRPSVQGHLVTAGGLASAIVVLVLIVVGISNSTGGSDNDASSGSAMSSNSSESAKSSSSSSGATTAIAPAATPQQQRAVIRDVTLTLSTTPAQVEDVSDRAIGVADALGGYVQDSSVTARRSADITLRVPSDKLQQALSQLSRLAHVSSRTQSAQDVTDQRASLDAAVRDARAYRDSLRSRLARAKTDREASSMRGRLQRAEQSLRSSERDVARLSQQTSMATIDLNVRGNRSSGAAPVKSGGRWTPADALRDAGHVLEFVAGVALIALAVALPLALLGAAAAFAARMLSRRRRERALELA